jgi:hypothetical protein
MLCVLYCVATIATVATVTVVQLHHAYQVQLQWLPVRCVPRSGERTSHSVLLVHLH